MERTYFTHTITTPDELVQCDNSDTCRQHANRRKCQEAYQDFSGLSPCETGLCETPNCTSCPTDCDLGRCRHRDCLRDLIDVGMATWDIFIGRVDPPRDCVRGACSHEVCPETEYNDY